MEENKETKKDEKIIDKLKEETEKLICNILEQGINENNLDYLYKVVDIHKDISNEEYWKQKEENEMYGNYGRDSYGEYNEGGSYGRDEEMMYSGGRRRDSRGRYMEGGSYGRRGYDTKYRGHDMLDEMNYSYGAYSDNNEYGNYGETSTKELKKMLDCNIALIEHLKNNAKSQEEIEIIDRKVQEMSRL